jgi:hypothetical protein
VASVLAPLLRAALYVALLSALGEVLVLRWSAPDGWAIFGEDGRLEIAQLVLLALALAGAGLLALRRPETRPVSVLLAGLFLAVLVREHNNLLKDHGFRGLWQVLVGLVVLASLALSWPSRANAPAALRRFFASPSIGWLAAGVLALTFGQLFDEVVVWTTVLGRADFPYATRRVVEESFELLAYASAAIAVLEYRLALGPRSPAPPRE